MTRQEMLQSLVNVYSVRRQLIRRKELMSAFEHENQVEAKKAVDAFLHFWCENKGPDNMHQGKGKPGTVYVYVGL